MELNRVLCNMLPLGNVIRQGGIHFVFIITALGGYIAFRTSPDTTTTPRTQACNHNREGTSGL